MVQLRKTKDITQEQWICETNSDNMSDLAISLDEMVLSLDQELKWVMDTLAPTKEMHPHFLGLRGLGTMKSFKHLRGDSGIMKGNGLNINYNQIVLPLLYLGISTHTS